MFRRSFDGSSAHELASKSGYALPEASKHSSAPCRDISLFFGLLFAILLAIGDAKAIVKQEHCETVMVSIRCVNIDCTTIAITIRNNTSASVEFSESNLPWNSPAMFGVSIFTLLPFIESVDPGVWHSKNSPGTVSIDSGAELSGQIDILDMYPALWGRIGHERFILVWVARIFDVRGNFLSACTGSLFVGRGPFSHRQ